MTSKQRITGKSEASRRGRPVGKLHILSQETTRPIQGQADPEKQLEDHVKGLYTQHSLLVPPMNQHRLSAQLLDSSPAGATSKHNDVSQGRTSRKNFYIGNKMQNLDYK